MRRQAWADRLWQDRRWMTQVFSMELRQALSYRVDFWIQFLGTTLVTLALAYFLWAAVYEFRGVESIEGYTFKAMMFYYLLVPLMSRFVLGQESGYTISTEIYQGTLNRYLVYPVSFLQYKWVGHLARACIALIQFFVGVVLYISVFGAPSEIRFDIAHILMGLSLGLAAGMFYYCVTSSIEMVSFWADNVWSLMVMLRMVVILLSGSLIPLNLFPVWAQEVLSYLPFPYLVYVPIQFLIGSGSWQDWLSALLVISIWSVVASLMMVRVWSKGTRQYTGVGI